MRLPITVFLAGYSLAAFAISNNNSMVTNTMTALSAQVCTGQTKISTCGKMRGSVGIVAGVGVPSTYSMDELAFIRDSGSVSGISPSNFSGTGTASAGTPSNSASLMCYVLDVDAGAPGTYNFSCEMTGLSCNKLYRYHFAGSHTTAGAAEHSNTNTTGTSLHFYTTPCTPAAGANGTSTATSVDVSVSIPNGALAQTMSVEYGLTTAYGSTGTITSGATVAAANSGNTTVAATLSGLTCGTTYHYRFNSTTNDGAVNGSTMVNGADQAVTPACPAPGAGSVLSTSTYNAVVTVPIPQISQPQAISLEYGPTVAYGSTAPVTSTSGATVPAGSGTVTVFSTLEPLACNTTYHYRFRSTIGASTGNGPNQTFTTAACPPAPPPEPPPTTINSGGTTQTINGTGVVRITDNAQSGTVLTLSGSGPTLFDFGAGNTVQVQHSGQTRVTIVRTTDNRLGLRVDEGVLVVGSFSGNQPVVVAGNGTPILAGSGGASVRATFQNGKLKTLTVTSGQILLPGNLFAASSSSLVAGEVAEFDAAERVAARYLGGSGGSTGALGDFLALGGVANVPRISGVPERHRASGRSQRLDEQINELLRPLGLNAALQDERGVLLVRGGQGSSGLQSMLPLGRIALVEGEADRLTIQADGSIRAVLGGYAVTFVPSVANPAGLATAFAGRYPGATVTLGPDGTWKIVESSGQTTVVRPGWELSPANGVSGLGVDGAGRQFYAHDPLFGSVLHPGVASHSTVLAAARTLDPNATLTAMPGQNPLLVVSGRSYTLFPESRLTPRDGSHVNDAYWLSGGKLFVPVNGQTAQGFAMQ